MVAETATQQGYPDYSQGWWAPSVEESTKVFEIPDEGVYTFRLKKWHEPKPVSAEFDATGTKTRSQFEFEIVGDEDYEGFTINKWMNISMNEKADMYKYVKAMLGGRVDPTVRIVPPVIEGKTFMAQVEHTDPKKDKDGRIWAAISNPIPLAQPRRPRGSRTTVTDVAETLDATVVDENGNEVPF